MAREGATLRVGQPDSRERPEPCELIAVERLLAIPRAGAAWVGEDEDVVLKPPDCGPVTPGPAADHQWVLPGFGGDLIERDGILVVGNQPPVISECFDHTGPAGIPQPDV